MTFVSIFKNKTGIEAEIDSFLNMVSESGLIFTQGVNEYFSGDIDAFGKHLTQIVETEQRADALRRSIEDLLYRRTLIPESRGDVLKLIEGMDSLLGGFKGAIFRIEIERPEIGREFTEDFRSLVKCSVEAVEAVTLSVRSFFKNIAGVADHIHKVSFWETEADKLSTKLQSAIFRMERLELCQQLQLRDLVRQVDSIADHAEDMADSLAIYVIKRSL